MIKGAYQILDMVGRALDDLKK